MSQTVHDFWETHTKLIIITWYIINKKKKKRKEEKGSKKVLQKTSRFFWKRKNKKAITWSKKYKNLPEDGKQRLLGYRKNILEYRKIKLLHK